LFVEVFGGGASTFTIRGGECVRRAADFEWASGGSSSGADALEESAVEDVAGGAAVEA
jgi:hypothetical protein